MRALALIGMLWAGCAKTPPLTVADYESPPHLPAPRAGTYAQVPADPPDALIARIVEGHGWDASLGGAAAGLALGILHDDHPITAWRVREATWRAGYPYPVSRVRAWSTPPGTEPPPELQEWLDAVPGDADLGLVRGRDDRMDVWVALVAKPRASIGVQPRQASLGSRIELPPLAGCSYSVADPDGRLFEGALELSQRFALDIPGEWLFRVDDDQGPVAVFPVYAGMVPPETTLLDDAELLSSGDLKDRAVRVLTTVRELYGVEPWRRDARLDMAASALLGESAPTTEAIAGSLGYDPTHFSRWECVGTSLEDCLDRVIWDPRARPGLLGATRYLGLATTVDAGEVRIVALLAPG